MKKPVWDYFWKKTQGNQTLTKLAEDQAELVFSKYNVLVEDKTKDEEYFLELKQKLQLRLQSKKAHDSRFFAYYVYHFKYYLFGACVV